MTTRRVERLRELEDDLEHVLHELAWFTRRRADLHEEIRRLRCSLTPEDSAYLDPPLAPTP